MTNEERLSSLVGQARQQRGEAILQSPAELTALLAGWAPDLQAEGRVLALALAQGAGPRLAGSPNVEAEMASLATFYAAQTGAPGPAAYTAMRAVRMLPAASAPGMPPAPVANRGGAPVPFYEQGVLKKTWLRVVLGLMAFGLIFNLLTGKFQQPAAPVQPPGAQDPGGSPQQPQQPQQGG